MKYKMNHPTDWCYISIRTQVPELYNWVTLQQVQLQKVSSLQQVQLQKVSYTLLKTTGICHVNITIKKSSKDGSAHSAFYH